ncbi:phage holin family protein [Roseibium salinum]|uniref:Phage holin family protein n=1 Tax=Roseibium salinum TaxID=1604349 RepID=A0ABT3QWX3_9HYPH|nr:phage holin family protein [Roseibium sp. DSM 29163]MCX2721440.1 phage holin family protein [Roseibium sp. DSM 29163]
MTDHTTKESTRSIFGDLLTHATNLMRGEFDLARAEMNDNLKSAGAAVGMIVGGVVIALTALNVLAAATVSALTEAGIAAGWSAMIVGVTLAIIAFVLAQKGMKDLKLSNLAPTRTARNVRRDAATVRESYHES